MNQLKKVPQHGERGSDVLKLKSALIAAGFDPRSKEENKDLYDDATDASVKAFQKSKGLPGSGKIPSNGGMTFEYLGLEVGDSNVLPIVPTTGTTPWGKEARSDLGKKETDRNFEKKVVGFWPKVGLNLKIISKNWAAWCGVGIAMWLTLAGFPVQKDGGGAKNWAKYGRAIEWQENGIPEGAILYINHNQKCGSGSGNHVTLSYGSCAAKDLVMKKNSKGVWEYKPGASVNGLGGNQGNMVKVSAYPVSHICAVRWPIQDLKGKAYPAPQKVLVSKNCFGKVANESTR